MWEPTSHHPFTNPITERSIPSRHGIARRAYLDRKRAQAGSVGLRFRWAGRLGFEL
jgi:hypothetical protein